MNNPALNIHYTVYARQVNRCGIPKIHDDSYDPNCVMAHSAYWLECWPQNKELRPMFAGSKPELSGQDICRRFLGLFLYENDKNVSNACMC